MYIRYNNIYCKLNMRYIERGSIYPFLHQTTGLILIKHSCNSFVLLLKKNRSIKALVYSI